MRALVLALLAAVATACATVEREPLEAPVVSLLGLEPEALGINSQAFRARLGLFNPNSVPLRVTHGKVELALAGTPAARGRTLEPFTIEVGGSTEVDIRVTTHLLRDGPALFEALSAGGSGGGIAYALTGYVDVEQRGRDRIAIDARGVLARPEPAPAGPGGG